MTKIALLFLLVMAGDAARANGPCQVLTPEMVHEAVERVLATSSAGDRDGLQLEELQAAWFARCEPRPSLFRPSVAIDLARLLERLHLVSKVLPMLAEMGDAARPARPLIHRAYVTHRHDLQQVVRTYGTLFGPGFSNVHALRCLDLKLRTGRRNARYCDDLDRMTRSVGRDPSG
jgi:hypothetical protein